MLHSRFSITIDEDFRCVDIYITKDGKNLCYSFEYNKHGRLILPEYLSFNSADGLGSFEKVADHIKTTVFKLKVYIEWQISCAIPKKTSVMLGCFKEGGINKYWKRSL